MGGSGDNSHHDHHHHNPAAIPKVDQDLDLLRREQIPLHVRDNCAHILVDLNRCRRATMYNPWKCTTYRHLHDECQYIAWEARVAKKNAVKEEKAAAIAAAKLANA